MLVFPEVSKKRGAFETSGNTNAATHSRRPEPPTKHLFEPRLMQFQYLLRYSNIPLSYGIQIFTMFVTSCQWITSCARLIQSASAMFLRSIYTLSSHVRQDLQSDLFCSGFPINSSYTFLISPMPVMCRSHRHVPDLMKGKPTHLQGWTGP